MIVCERNDAGSLKMPWKNCIAVGRARDLLRADLLKHLAFLQHEIGYKYCRFHALFHDDMEVVKRRRDGSLAYQWHYVDSVYDSLLSLGLRPFVELNSMPSALASGSQTIFQYQMNVTPPKSYEAWGDLVTAFAAHIVARYGLDEVRQWYFEVWNEPNLPGFWAGTKEDYWRLYDASAVALKSVDAQLRVGGPATSKARWIADIIDHCTKNNVPIDFVSTHLYPQDEYVDYPDRLQSPHKTGEFFMDTVRSVKDALLASDRADLEIHWTEWNTLSTASSSQINWIENVYVDNQYAAAFIVRNCIALDRACDSLTYWVASDVFEECALPMQPFRNGYGLLTIHGIPKASFNAFRLLSMMRGSVASVTKNPAYPDGTGVCVTWERDSWRVLIWNAPPLELRNAPAWGETLYFPVNDDKSDYQVLRLRVEPGSGSAYETWLAMGRPTNLTRLEERTLRQHSEPQQVVSTVSAAAGMVALRFDLQPYLVEYWEITPREPAHTNVSRDANTTQWNVEMSEISR